MLNTLLGGVEPIIRKNGGRVDKFIGDAVMALFFAGEEDHALRAVRAAETMTRYLVVFNRMRQRKGSFPIAIGIGVNTGRVLLGELGNARRKDLTVIGDDVNLAARLEKASKLGRHRRIVLSESTFRRVEPVVEAEEMPVREVRGKQQGVRMFEFIRLLPAGWPRRGPGEARPDEGPGA